MVILMETSMRCVRHNKEKYVNKQIVQMENTTSSPANKEFSKYAQVYDPIKIGSIDGK